MTKNGKDSNPGITNHISSSVYLTHYWEAESDLTN